MSSSSSSSSSHHSDAPPSTAHADVLCMGHFCEKHGPSVVFVTESVSERVAQHVAAYGAAATAAHTNTTTTSTTPCAMCRSFADGAALISRDPDDAAVRFVSRRFPDESSSYARVRTACVRALSCEICPGREGPIMFGDDDGTVLSFAFRLRDSEARGFARWYSLILLSTDAYHVAACHASLTHYLRTVVRQLKQRALALFNRDMAAQTASASNPSDKNNNSSSNSSGNSSVVSMTPGLFRKEAGSTKLRSLVELTQCPPLFSELHTQFAWILKAYRQRFVLKPPPLIDLRIFPQTEAVCAAVAATAAAESAEAAASSSSAATASNVLRVSSLFHALGDADEIILFCVLSGRRVFVRGQQPDDAPLAADVCRVLVQLLPANVAWHIKTLTSADVSLDSVPATTRFVVLPPDYEIPADVAPASFALIDVLQCAPLRVACSGPTRSSWLGAALRDALVRRRQLNETALLCLIEYVKSSWLSKCELYSAFVAAQPKAAAAHGRADAIDAERVDRFLQVVGLTGKDLALLHYWCSFLKPQQ